MSCWPSQIFLRTSLQWTQAKKKNMFQPIYRHFPDPNSLGPLHHNFPKRPNKERLSLYGWNCISSTKAVSKTRPHYHSTSQNWLKNAKNKLDQKNVSKNDGNCSDSQFFEWLHPWFVLHPKELMHIICIAGWRLMGKAAQMMAKAAFFAGDSKKTHQHRKNNINIYIHIQYTHMHPINSSHCTGYSIGIPIWAGCRNVQKKATLK